MDRPEVLPRISTATTRDFYLVYLTTSDWKARRLRALKDADFKCQKCGRTRGLEVHHTTYERIGREWDQDLQVLCDDCHVDHHVTTAGADLGVYLKLARQAFAAAEFVSIADLNADFSTLCAKHRIPIKPALMTKALSLVTSREALVKPARRRPIVTPDEPVHYAAPCACRACREAGVDTRRLRLDPHTGEWLHGDELKRWYEAFDAFQQRARTAAGSRGRHAAGFERLVASRQ